MTLRRRLAPLVPRAIRRGDFHAGLGSHPPELVQPYVVDKPTGADTRLDRRSGILLTEPPFGVRPQRERLLCEVPSDGGVIRTPAYEMRGH